MALLLSVDDSGDITRAVIERAKAGDMVAARFCLKQILPKRRSREIELDLPECHDIDGVVSAFEVTVAAMAAGEITPDEALTVSKVLDRRRRAIEAKARRADRGAEDAAVVAPVVETPASAAASDLHSACIYVPDGVSPVTAPTQDTPAQAPAPGLHSACNDRPDEASAAPAGLVPAPERRSLPTFGSACIPPAIRGRLTRRAMPVPPGPPATDCPPSPRFA